MIIVSDGNSAVTVDVFRQGKKEALKMLKTGRALSYAWSSLNQIKTTLNLQAARHVSVSSKCLEDVSQEDINKLFAPDDREQPRRVFFCMNRVELIGGIASDLRVRTGKNGKEFVSFSVATNQVLRNTEGQRIGVATEFHPVVSFNSVEMAKRELAKGQRIYLSGRIHYSPVTLADGGRANRPTIVAENYHIIKPINRRNHLEEGFENSEKNNAPENVE
uniref:Single-stranded DNA-binding protein n=1 Tax=Syphacia muris TaxID=451379 RepID=A0A0N5A9U5_9BILA